MRASVWFAQGTRFSEVMAGDAMAEFMRVCPERPFRRGEYLFRQGDPASHMHVIAQGQVKLVTLTPEGHERVIAVVGPDDFIGEAFVIDTEHYLLDAVAITDVVACPMDRDQFTQLALHSPTFTVRLRYIVTGRWVIRLRMQVNEPRWTPKTGERESIAIGVDLINRIAGHVAAAY